ncbi:imidazole glycerol phosphate synthase subunit HisH [Pontibacter ummariensis]|uniref:Imidazole glycerol phosphate synthase subunit HisH n=1 Tax=Pontibacter ummariensis TaxID=1610492 RepID=A0A239BXQ6_9BACT|nr:imidazole glycerol phosphate synthase subunit HisH [Pontibacter ummariensis]PRY15581.1 imidazole glycerol phosphate synthase subunit HisH [Pontibacter ummariensis]SNS12211.1 imidazole glycerol phosphate synthase subunit hisH [Pontibacter ummariensis]
MNLVIVDYKAGNVQSVMFALERLNIQATLSCDFETIKAADKVIFPGVGEASSAMEQLKARNLDKLLPTLEQPFFGVCLGMQLLCQHSEEGETPLLGIIPLEVKRFQTDLKVPHMGWNQLEHLASPLFAGLQEKEYAYYVHSYYVPLSDYTIAQTSYPEPFSAALHYKNFYAVQFHPEKSGPAGSQILKNFLAL